MYEMNNNFTNSSPNLIDNKALVEWLSFNISLPKPSKSILGYIYTEIVQPNLFLLVLLFLTFLFLILRYYIKNNESENFRPTFNPFFPTDMQQSYVNYLPDEIPLKVGGKY